MHGSLSNWHNFAQLLLLRVAVDRVSSFSAMWQFGQFGRFRCAKNIKDKTRKIALASNLPNLQQMVFKYTDVVKFDKSNLNVDGHDHDHRNRTFYQ